MFGISDYDKVENEIAFEKAKKWDSLMEEISKFYFDKNGNEWPQDKYDLTDIGEAAAIAFGFL